MPVNPKILTIPFARDAAPGLVNTIPDDPSGSSPQRASWKQGFPPITMIPLTAGGIPPQGQDFNGALKAISEHVSYINGGGQYKFNAEWAAENGGYPKGATLLADDEESLWMSLVDDNSENFNTGTPANWVVVLQKDTQERIDSKLAKDQNLADVSDVPLARANLQIITPFLAKERPHNRALTATKAGSTVTVTAVQPFSVMGFIVPGGAVLASASVVVGTDYALHYNRTTQSFALSANFNPADPVFVVGGLHIYGNGDLAVNSIWDQGFRPACPNPRGMVYSNLQNKWGDIYLLGVNHITDGTSRYGVTIADGAAPPKIPVIYGGNGSAAYSRMGYFETRDVLDSHGKFMPDMGLFASFANGSALGTSIDSDPVTTGHSAGYRSAAGIEQATGHLWIWSREQSAADSANTWHDMGTGRGDWYGGYFRTALLGALWDNGSRSGPDSVNWDSAPTDSVAGIGGRGFSDHLVG